MWTLCKDREPPIPGRISSCSLDTIVLPLPGIILILTLLLRLILHLFPLPFKPAYPHSDSESSHSRVRTQTSRDTLLTSSTASHSGPRVHFASSLRTHSSPTQTRTRARVARWNERYWSSRIGQLHAAVSTSSRVAFASFVTVNILALVAAIALTTENIILKYRAGLGIGLLVFVPSSLGVALLMLRDRFRPYFLFPFYISNVTFRIFDILKAVRVNDDFARSQNAGLPPTHPEQVYNPRYRLVYTVIIFVLFLILNQIEFTVLIGMHSAGRHPQAQAFVRQLNSTNRRGRSSGSTQLSTNQNATIGTDGITMRVNNNSSASSFPLRDEKSGAKVDILTAVRPGESGSSGGDSGAGSKKGSGKERDKEVVVKRGEERQDGRRTA